MQTAPWRHWSFALVTVSVLGTLLAGVTLAFDGWRDALVLYAACVFLLTLMLYRFAGQQMQPVALAKHGRADPGSRRAGLVLTGADRAATPATLGNAASLGLIGLALKVLRSRQRPRGMGALAKRHASKTAIAA